MPDLVADFGVTEEKSIVKWHMWVFNLDEQG